MFDVVLGSDVAERLGYTIGRILLYLMELPRLVFKTMLTSHLSGRCSSCNGTPVDKSVHVSLKALLATYRLAGWRPQKMVKHIKKNYQMDLIPADVTAALIKLNKNSDI